MAKAKKSVQTLSQYVERMSHEEMAQVLSTLDRRKCQITFGYWIAYYQSVNKLEEWIDQVRFNCTLQENEVLDEMLARACAEKLRG